MALKISSNITLDLMKTMQLEINNTEIIDTTSYNDHMITYQMDYTMSITRHAHVQGGSKRKYSISTII